MTALITGGTGFLGSEVARVLLSGGCAGVTLFDSNPSAARLGGLSSEVVVIRGDLGNASDVDAAVARSRPDTIYHLGGMLSAPSEADHAAAFRVNAAGTFNVLEAARAHGVPQVLFASTINTYGHDLPEDAVDDYTLQRPAMFYGTTKLFGEHMGRFYRRKFGLDFRGIRYPSIIGPGVTTPGISQYTSRAIEASARGEPYTIFVEPRTRVPIIYISEAAKAIVKLAAAPADRIETVVYLLAGTTPTPTAQDLADAIRARLPHANLDFRPAPAIQAIHDARRALASIDDTNARHEWAWRPEYDLPRIVDEMVNEIRGFEGDGAVNPLSLDGRGLG